MSMDILLSLFLASGGALGGYALASSGYKKRIKQWLHSLQTELGQRPTSDSSPEALGVAMAQMLAIHKQFKLEAPITDTVLPYMQL
jgi:hypothetical protein